MAWNSRSEKSDSWTSGPEESHSWTEKPVKSSDWRIWIRGNPYGVSADFSDQLDSFNPVNKVFQSVAFAGDEIFKAATQESGGAAVVDDEIFIASPKNVDIVRFAQTGVETYTEFGQGGFNQTLFGKQP